MWSRERVLSLQYKWQHWRRCWINPIPFILSIWIRDYKRSSTIDGSPSIRVIEWNIFSISSCWYGLNTSVLILAGVILFLVAIGFNVWYDYRKWKRNLNASSNLRNHNKGWRLKAITCLISIYFLTDGSGFIWFVALPLVLLGEMVLFNTLFDGFLSLCKGKWFFYLGSKDATHDPHTDNIWMGVPTWLHITLKVCFSLISIYIYYVGTKK